MTRVRKLVEELRSRSGLTVEDQKDAWLVHIPKGQEFVCEVTIPRDRFEWFASVKRIEDKKEAWGDWMDHYGSTDTELDAERAECILAFIERVLRSELQLPLIMYEEKA